MFKICCECDKRKEKSVNHTFLPYLCTVSRGAFLMIQESIEKAEIIPIERGRIMPSTELSLNDTASFILPVSWVFFIKNIRNARFLIPFLTKKYYFK